MPYDELFKLDGGTVKHTEQVQRFNFAGKAITADTINSNNSNPDTIAANNATIDTVHSNNVVAVDLEAETVAVQSGSAEVINPEIGAAWSDSGDIAITGNNAAYAESSKTGALTLVAANYNNFFGRCKGTLKYNISGRAGTFLTFNCAGLEDADIDLSGNLSNGNHTIPVLLKPNVADLVFTATSDNAAAAFTIKDVEIEVVPPGDIAGNMVGTTLSVKTLRLNEPGVAGTGGGNDAALAANSANGTGLPTSKDQAGWLVIKDSNGNDAWIPYWQ